MLSTLAEFSVLCLLFCQQPSWPVYDTAVSLATACTVQQYSSWISSHCLHSTATLITQAGSLATACTVQQHSLLKLDL